MPRHRILVYATQRKDLDPVLMAQLIIMLGRELAQQTEASPEPAAAVTPSGEPEPQQETA